MLNFLRKQMKWVMAIIVVAFLLSTFLMYEGRSTRRTPGRNADGTMTDYEVASINGRSLMRSELERRLRNYLETFSTRSMVSLDMPALYQAVLDQAVLESQLAREVEEKGIRVSDAEADRAMKEYADTYYPTRETFYQALAQSGIKIEDYKRNLARQMAVEQLMRNAVGEIVISEDRAIEFYDTMKPLIYSRPEGFNMHIADFRTSADAEVLYAKLAAGESWDVIASSDELASQDVINITKTPIFLPSSTFRTGVFSAIASLDIGQPSQVIAMSSNDYAVVLKTEHVEASITPYEEVSNDVKATLTTQEERSRLTEYQTSLREKAQVVINDTELFARPAVSEDTTAPANDIVPEIVIEEASEDTPAPAVEETKAEEPKEPETAPEPSIVVEESKEEEKTEPEAEPAAIEETPAPVEDTPAPAEETPAEPEAVPATEDTPATETPSEPETEAVPEPAETPTVEDTPAPFEDTATQSTEPETPAPVEETPAATPEPEESAEPAETAETPSEIHEETKTEEPHETAEEPEQTAESVVENVVEKAAGDIPLQEEITDEITAAADKVEEIVTEAVIDKPAEDIISSSDAAE